MPIVLNCKLEIVDDDQLSYTDSHKRASSGPVFDDYLTLRTIDRLAAWVEQREDSTKSDFELLGRYLYRLLFGDAEAAGAIRRDFEHMYESFLDMAEQDDSTRLRLWLIFHQEAARLASLPWEFLFMPDPRNEKNGIFLAGEETKLILTRFVPEVGEIVADLKPETGALRILVAHAFPEDPDEELPKLDDQAKEIVAKIKAIQGENATEEETTISVKELTNPTFDELQASITQERPHIFHFIGHGKPGQLALFRKGEEINKDLARKRKRVEAQWCTSEEVTRLFAKHKPRLVFLHACHGGASFIPASASMTSLKSLTSMARDLVYAEVPAVIAMQYAISNTDAAEFAESFYTSISRGLPLDEAVAVARQKLATPTGREAFGHRRFATPLVYLQTNQPIITAAPIDGGDAEPGAGQEGLVACPYCQKTIGPLEAVAQLGWECIFCRRPFGHCEMGHVTTLDEAECPVCHGRVISETGFVTSGGTTPATAQPASARATKAGLSG